MSEGLAKLPFALSGAWIGANNLGGLLSSLHEQLGDQCGPAGLMGCSDTATAVAVKVFVELQILVKIRISLQQGLVTEYGSTSRAIVQKDSG